jgi:hypothetical protein
MPYKFFMLFEFSFLIFLLLHEYMSTFTYFYVTDENKIPVCTIQSPVKELVCRGNMFIKIYSTYCSN